MSKTRERAETLQHDFTYANEPDLAEQVRAFATAHEAAHDGERLAMDARQPLGAGRVRVRFRRVPPKRRR